MGFFQHNSHSLLLASPGGRRFCCAGRCPGMADELLLNCAVNAFSVLCYWQKALALVH